MPPPPPMALPADDPSPPPPATGARQATAVASQSIATPAPAKQVRGRLATASDTESQAFANAPSVTVHDGKVEGRKGLTVRVYEPRFSIRSESDLYALGSFHGVFGVLVRPDGSIRLVKVIETSGSTYVDDDCIRVLYAGYFEPGKDKDGHPIETTWRIVYN